MHISIASLLLLILAIGSKCDDENGVSGEVEMRFPIPTIPFVLHKNLTLLEENNGTITVVFQANEDYNEDTGINTNKAIQAELTFGKEEPGKLYPDFAFKDWFGDPLTEVVGNQTGEPHKYVFNRANLHFLYNKSSPDFNLTVTELPFLEGCECNGFTYEYPDGIPNPTKYPTAFLILELPRNCSRLACGWASIYDIKMKQEIEFSFLGTHDKKDRFYIRNSKGTTSLFPEDKPYKRFRMMIDEPFVIYFIGGETTEKDRRMSLQFTYETQE